MSPHQLNAYGFLAAFVAVVATPKHAPRDFFTATAQIVVVLMLAVALQSRLLWVRSLEIEPIRAPGSSESAGYNLPGTLLARTIWTDHRGCPSALCAVRVAGGTTENREPRRGSQEIMGAIAWVIISLLTTADLASPRHPPTPKPANGDGDEQAKAPA
jgi:hypothetical protein